MINQAKKIIKGKFITYCFFGGIAALVELTGFYILNQILGQHYITSTIIALAFSATTNYSLQRKFTFKNTYRDKKKQFAVFIIITIIGLIVNSIVTAGLIELLQLWPPIAKIFAILSATVSNFILNKKITFGKMK